MKYLFVTLALAFAVIGGTVAVAAITGTPAHAECGGQGC